MSDLIGEIQNEAVRRLIAAFMSDGETFRSTLHPEIEWYTIEEERRVTRGIDAAVRNRDNWLGTWRDHRLDVEDVVEQGDDVVALIHLTGKGRASGVDVEVRFYAQFKVRDGKVVYIYDHDDRTAALAAAGLPPS